MAQPFCLIDFESASSADLKKCGAWVYAADVTTEILCLGYWSSRTGGTAYVLTAADLQFGNTDPEFQTDVEDPAVMFVAHNASFEKAIWREIMVKQYGWPDIPNERWHDTQAVCAMKGLPLALERAAAVLGLHHHKDMEGSRLTVAMSRPNKAGYFDRAPEKLQRVYTYNKDDIAAELDLHRTIKGLGPEERAVWLLNQEVNERGLYLDQEFIRQAEKIVADASVPLEAEFARLTGGLKTTQAVKLLAWVKANGANIPNLQKETLALVLGTNYDGDEEPDEDDWLRFVKLTPEVRRVLAIRQLIGSASIKKLARMRECTSADGRSRGLLQYHGTGPGRSAGRLWQPMNLPRGTLSIDGGEPPEIEPLVAAIMTGDAAYVETLYGPPVEAVVSSLRFAIKAAPGRTLVAGDYAGIQARVVLAIAGQHDKTALMASGADIYCDMASQIYKRPITKKHDPKERQYGKNSVLGLGFQMGWPKFKLKYARDDTDEFCQEIVRVYRKEWAPKVPKVWYALEEAAVRAVHERRPHEAFGILYRLEDRWLTARLPSGRKIWYFNPTPTRKAMPWDETDVRLAFTYQAMKMGQWRTIDAFGGQLTENVVMGIEQDLLRHAMLKCGANGFPIVLEVYDEIVTEPLTKDADPATLQQIMEDVPEWCKHMQVPVAVEVWAGERYRK